MSISRYANSAFGDLLACVGPDRSRTLCVCCYFLYRVCDPHHIGGAGNLPRCLLGGDFKKYPLQRRCLYAREYEDLHFVLLAMRKILIAVLVFSTPALALAVEEERESHECPEGRAGLHAPGARGRVSD